MSSAAIVLAAGEGRRFGSQKMLADLDGEPLLNRTLQSVLDGGVDRIVVVRSLSSDLERVTLLADPRVTVVVNPDPDRGMFSSILAGLSAAERVDAILILPGDMPFVRAETISAVSIECARTDRIVSPRFNGERGHPIALPGRLRRMLLAAPAGTTLSDVLKPFADERTMLDVTDAGVVRDVDVPEDLR